MATTVAPGEPADAGAPQNVASPAVGDPSAHRAILTDFIEAFRNGTPPCCDGVQARRSVAVVEAIYASARAGGPVVVRRDEIPITIQKCV